MTNKITIIIPFIVFVTASLFFAGSSYLETLHVKQTAQNKISTFKKIKNFLSENLISPNKSWPKSFEIEDKQFEVKYTFNEDLTSKVKKLIKRYRPDYASVIVIENDTGNILSSIGFQRDGGKFIDYLPFSATHPSASLIKIVTAAELLENTRVKPDTSFKFRGRGTTLYKHQLYPKKNRRQRSISFKRAFSSSNNVVFGKAALQKIKGSSFFKMATDFGFNKRLMSELDVSSSTFEMPTDQYNLAELASGFNTDTKISPLHAALLSSVIANDGVMKSPRLLSELTNEAGEDVWQTKGVGETRVVSSDTAKQLKKLMKLTVKKGTARAGFRRLNRKITHMFELGGKTGSITGGIPYGKRDWFTAFAVPHDSTHGGGISVSVMMVNKEKWYVRSTYIARRIIEYYYDELKKEEKVSHSGAISHKSGV